MCSSDLDGVLPAYNIRTDRFDIAMDAYDKITRASAKKENKRQRRAEAYRKIRKEMYKDAIKYGVIMGNQAKKDQFEENKQLMEHQAELNRQQAFYSTGLARDLWNYTNYENSMRHIKGAGLSPGLIYGQSGAGGSTSGAGQASGVGQPNKTGTEVGLQAQGMALQLANVMSQTRLNESQAEKNKAEANIS